MDRKIKWRRIPEGNHADASGLYRQGAGRSCGERRGPNPFAPVGQGRIDWHKTFAQAHQAGVKHIFIEQDRSDMAPLDAIKISYAYLRSLRLS